MIAVVALLAASLASRALAVPVPGTAGHITASGYLDGLAVAPTEDSKGQRPQLVGVVSADGSAARWLHGRLTLRSRIGGPFEGGQGVGVFDFDREFQNRSPSLEFEEGWVELRGRQLELRAGIQAVAWGKLDGIPPTDIVNPRDFHDPLVADFEERKIGIPALLGTWFLPDPGPAWPNGMRLSLLYVPIAVPSRLPLVLERWFPSSIALGPRLNLPKTLNGLPLPPDIAVHLGTLSNVPARTFDNGGIGARFGGTWGRFDWDLYHYTGPETGPNASLRVSVQNRNPVDFDDPNALNEIADSRLVATTRLRQETDTIHMTGADLAFPLGGFTVRAEAAYFIDKPYLRDTSTLLTNRNLLRATQGPACPALKTLNLQDGCPILEGAPTPIDLGELFPDLDSIEWGIGADYLWHGVQPILQLNQIVFLEKTPPLLVADPETRISGSVRKAVLDDRLVLELRGIYAIERESWYVFPRVSYLVRDDLRVRLGYLAIGGQPNSLIGQYKQNDEFVMQARWTF